MMRGAGLVVLALCLSSILCQAAPKVHKNYRTGSSVTLIPKDKADVLAKSRKAHGSKSSELSNNATLLLASRIYGKLVASLVGGPISKYPSASQALEWYLGNTGEELYIEEFVADMVANRSAFSILARRCLIQHRNAFAEAAEALVPVNSTNYWISTIAERAHSTRLEDGLHCAPVNGEERKVGNLLDWAYSVGKYRVWIQGSINRTSGPFGDNFFAEMHYNVRGFYGSWPASGDAFGGLAKNADLARLHTWGLAKEYPFSGEAIEAKYSDSPPDEFGKSAWWYQLERWPQI